MIKLIRKKHGMKILELRYPEKPINDKSFLVVLVRSFNNLRAEGWNKRKHICMTINLENSLDKLFNNMNVNYKKHIRREEREKIRIKIARTNNEYLKFYNGIYLELCKEKKVRRFPFEYLKEGCLWYSEKNGKILSGAIFYSDNYYVTEIFNAPKHIQYNGNRLLVWKAIQYYKKKGLKEFNFGIGFSDYKKRFGSYEKIVWEYMRYNSIILKFLNKIRKITKSIIHHHQIL